MVAFALKKFDDTNTHNLWCHSCGVGQDIRAISYDKNHVLLKSSEQIKTQTESFPLPTVLLIWKYSVSFPNLHISPFISFYFSISFSDVLFVFAIKNFLFLSRTFWLHNNENEKQTHLFYYKADVSLKETYKNCVKIAFKLSPSPNVDENTYRLHFSPAQASIHAH